MDHVKPCAGAGCLELGEFSPLGFYSKTYLTFEARVISLGWYFRNGVSCAACRNARRLGAHARVGHSPAVCAQIKFLLVTKGDFHLGTAGSPQAWILIIFGLES